MFMQKLNSDWHRLRRLDTYGYQVTYGHRVDERSFMMFTFRTRIMMGMTTVTPTLIFLMKSRPYRGLRVKTC